MAIYHYHREIGKRTQGKNAVFATAYMRAENRTCHRINESVVFSKKPNVIFVDCLLPSHAPEWAQNLRYSKIRDEKGDYVYDETGRNFSDYVWNQIEIIEKRKDAQLYFHDDMAIPNELSQIAAIELIKSFVLENLAQKEIFCDVAIHWEEGNHHAHVVMPLRQMIETGFSKKIRFAQGELSQQVERIRQAWSDFANRQLQAYGFSTRIDHRSFKDRGLDLEPTRKIGKIKYIEGSDLQKKLIAENQQIKAINFDQIQQDPELLKMKLAQERVSFSPDDLQVELARYVVNDTLLMTEQKAEDPLEKLMQTVIAELNQHHTVFSDKTLQEIVFKYLDTKIGERFENVLERLKNAPELIELGLGEDGRHHFTTRRAFELESGMSKMTESLSNQHTFLVHDDIIKRVAEHYQLNESQQRALTYITQSGNLKLITGFAGTGKTYLLKAAREVWAQSGYRVYGISLSGVAAAGLEKEAHIPSRTIHRFMNAVRGGYLKLNQKTIVVMDEMGMTALDQMQEVLSTIHSISAKFVGVGDTEQTQPVSRGSPMKLMMEQVGCFVMDNVMRQKTAWQREATIALETQQTSKGLDLYQKNGCVVFKETQKAAKKALVEQWVEQLQKNDFKNINQFILVAHKNETVTELNQLAREKLIQAGRLEKGAVVQTETGGAIHQCRGQIAL